MFRTITVKRVNKIGINAMRTEDNVKKDEL